MARRRRVLELRALGMTIPQIAETLRGENYRQCSERTVARDLSSHDYDDYVDELIRRQNAEINLQQDPRIRLEYRDRMLARLIPRRMKQEVKGELAVQQDYQVTLERVFRLILERHPEDVPAIDAMLNMPVAQVVSKVADAGKP